MDLPTGPRYVHVDNGRFQPRLTLPEIRKFLGNPDYYNDVKGATGARTWANGIIRGLLAVPK